MPPRAWVEISLESITHNIHYIKSLLKPQTRLMAVVKADAYGHGVVNVVRVMLESGANYIGVASLPEAMELRQAKITEPILILGYTRVEDTVEAVKNDITATVCNFSTAKAMSNAALRLGKTCKIHIKIDVGMNRLGYMADDEYTIHAIQDIAKLPHLEIEGIYTHLPNVDDETVTLSQFSKFENLIKKLKVNIKIKHVCNSAATIRFPYMHLDMVRPGIMSYGGLPSAYFKEYNLPIRSAMRLKTIISHIKEIPAGTKVSYDGTYTAQRPTKVATLPIGYADGYSRLLTGKAHAVVDGKRAPIIGKICMDQCMIDVTNVNTLSIEDEVVLFGDENLKIGEVASWMNTINYEIMTLFGRRVPRVYRRHGAVTDIKKYL